MRISDWSSDVCSSDLIGSARQHFRENLHSGERPHHKSSQRVDIGARDDIAGFGRLGCHLLDSLDPIQVRLLDGALKDRKSVGWGKSVSGRVDLGGRRNIKKKKKQKKTIKKKT